MALNLDALEITPGDGFKSRRSGRTAGPNPFLDKGWLAESYETGQDYTLTVQGTIEPYVAKDGVERERVTGEAKEIVSLLRSASNKLGVGVAIQCTPGKRKGTVVVQYVGKERRQRHDAEEVEESEETAE